MLLYRIGAKGSHLDHDDDYNDEDDTVVNYFDYDDDFLRMLMIIVKMIMNTVTIMMSRLMLMMIIIAMLMSTMTVMRNMVMTMIMIMRRNCFPPNIIQSTLQQYQTTIIYSGETPVSEKDGIRHTKSMIHSVCDMVQLLAGILCYICFLYYK
jgi:hypothetical protein